MTISKEEMPMTNLEKSTQLPTWERSDIESSRPKGLLDQLIDDGTVTQKFIMPNGMFEVRTSIHLVSGKINLFRSIVENDGSELTDDPWSPVVEHVLIDSGQSQREVRIHIARQALEFHLKRCKALSQALLAKKELRSGQSNLQVKILGGVALTAVLTTAAWFGYQQLQRETPLSIPSTEIPLADLNLFPIEVPDPTEKDDPEPAAPVESSQSEEPDAQEARAPAGSAIGDGSSSSSQKARKEARQAPISHEQPPARSRPETPPSPRQGHAQEETKPSTTVAKTPEQIKPSTVPVFGRVTPSAHRSFQLQVGASPYQGDDIKIARIPKHLQGISCITTQGSNGDTDQGMFAILGKNARILVAHDRRIKKPPKWLGDFQKTDHTISAQIVKRGKTFEYAIFQKAYETGEAISLGANKAGKISNVLKHIEGAPRSFKKRFMYIICADIS